MKTIILILVSVILSSCSSGPQAPDPFDVFLTETAREMFSTEKK